MALETTLPALLNTLTQSLTSATEAAPEASTTVPPKEGISLLDVKNELLLSYLQNLVFLILLKIRARHDDKTDDKLDDAVVKKLVELRVYLERGVRPLEGRLKYQIDKVLRAADDLARSTAAAAAASKKAEVSHDSDASATSDEDEDGSEEEDSDAESDNGRKADPAAPSIDALQYRPRPFALQAPADAPLPSATEDKKSDGIYRPPRINAVAMPTTDRREKEDRRPMKSAAIDEFINDELSTAPIAQPSIGSRTVYGGRKLVSEKERKAEQERRDYEERNYVRLPKESKKEKAKKRAMGQVEKPAGYGGEEWRELGAGVDRIERLTARKGGDGARSVLEKSRKRAAQEEGARAGIPGAGAEIGERFAKRAKLLEVGRRDRGRRK
jgi:U3 small nucleolar ribonucleoprotein protein LCP5